MTSSTGHDAHLRLEKRLMIFAEFGTGQVFWSMLWFFLFFIWIWMLIVIFGDIFRSQDLSGWGKALWSIFIIVLPYLGVFVYLIARGKKMQQHTIEASPSAGRGAASVRAASRPPRWGRRRRGDRPAGSLTRPGRTQRGRVPASQGEGVDLIEMSMPDVLDGTVHRGRRPAREERLSRPDCCPGSASSIPMQCDAASATRWPSSKAHEFAPTWPC